MLAPRHIASVSFTKAMISPKRIWHDQDQGQHARGHQNRSTSLANRFQRSLTRCIKMPETVQGWQAGKFTLIPAYFQLIFK